MFLVYFLVLNFLIFFVYQIFIIPVDVSLVNYISVLFVIKKKERVLQMKGIYKHKEATMKFYDNHRCLSWSEESKCVWNHVFLYIYSLLIDKDVSYCQNVSVKLPCVYLCLSPRDLFIFPVRVSSFFPTFVLSILRYFSFPCGFFVIIVI
jgi:hypothetical protein